MATLILPKSIQKLLVVGPIYNKLAKLNEVEKWLDQYDWVVFNDGIAFDPNEVQEIIPRLKKMDQLLSSGKVVYNAGSLDLITASKMDILDPDQSRIERWIRRKPNITIADFNGSFTSIILSGGIPTEVTNREQLDHNIKAIFATHPHETYTGGLGYVICNSPLTRWTPKFYRFSVQMGNVHEGQVYAFKVDRNGIQQTILV